jgi:hypothetical protein
MRRAIDFSRSRSSWWEEQTDRRKLAEKWLDEGLRAYASEQAAIEHHRAIAWFQKLYGVRERARVIRAWIDNPKQDLEENLRRLPALEIELEDDDI